MSILQNIPKLMFVVINLFLISSLAYGYDVSGTVFEPDSVTVIPGAEIYAYERGADDANVPPICVAQTLTDQNGNYTVTVDGAVQKYYIIAECVDISKGFGKRVRKWISGATTTAHVYMEVAHEGFTNITGTITNTSGDPVPDAKVVLRAKISTGGTARFNVDSAVTGADGKYLIPNAQVMVPEVVGEVVASFHISADGYDDGVVNPLDMIIGPEMVIDFVLTGGADIIVAGSKKINYTLTPCYGPNGTSIIINGISTPSQVGIYSANGTKLADYCITSDRSRIQIGSHFSRQLMIVEVVSNFHKRTHKIFLK